MKKFFKLFFIFFVLSVTNSFFISLVLMIGNAVDNNKNLHFLDFFLILLSLFSIFGVIILNNFIGVSKFLSILENEK